MNAVHDNLTSRIGVGTHLHRLLAAWGFTPSQRCFCEDHVAEMDRRGPQWCRDNFDLITDWLVEEARECAALGVLARIVPGPTRVATQRLIWQAIVLMEGGSE